MLKGDLFHCYKIQYSFKKNDFELNTINNTGNRYFSGCSIIIHI